MVDEHGKRSIKGSILRRMSLEVLQRSDWYGEPKSLGDTFRLHKQKCGQQLEAVCRLMTHALGWELRLEIAGSLQMSQVCLTQDEVLDRSDAWKAEMIDKSWS